MRLFTTCSTESGAVVMEGGSGPESASAPNAYTTATARKRKSLVELWIELRLEFGIELKIARMHHPSKGLAYHRRWASPSLGGPRKFFGSPEQFHTLSRRVPRYPTNVFNYLRKKING